MIAMTEILIPPDQIYGSKYPPLALACLATVLKEAGHKSKIVLFEPEQTPQEWLENVLALNPKVVAFSVFMGYKLERALELSRLVKRARPELPVLWGGVHPSLMPEETLRESSVDWVCVGAGEPMIACLAEAVENGGNPGGVPGLARISDGKMVVNGPGLPRRKEVTLSRPDWDSFPVGQFVFGEDPGERILGIMSSQGCPHDCGFCYNGRFHGRRWQPSPVESVQQEMLALRERFGANGFLFLDDLFFANRKRAVQLLNWMGENGFSCHSVDLRISEVNEDVLDALAKARAKSVFIGVESTVDRLLDLMKKGSTREDLFRAMEFLNRRPELRLWLSCIVGFPTETFEEMQQTISDLSTLAQRPNTMINLNTFIPMPGTGLYDLAIEHGFDPPQDAAGWTQLSIVRGSSLDHFPGRLTDAQTRYLQRAAHYLSMLYRPYPPERSGMLKRTTRNAFARAASYRINRRNLQCSIDLWLYQKLQGYSQNFRRRAQ